MYSYHNETEPKFLWVPNNTSVWRKAELIHTDLTTSTVHVVADDEGFEDETYTISDVHTYDPSHDEDLNDLSRLNDMHEAPLLMGCKRRFEEDKIYTRCGDVLLSMNPYKHIPQLYAFNDEPHSPTPGISEPHIYATAANVLARFAQPNTNSIINNKKSNNGNIRLNQSIIISGESGAGKTEASKHVMRYLIHESAKLQVESSAPALWGDSVLARLMDSNVILESFGNAKTVRNDNSSRFGKFIRLEYNDNCRIVGAVTEHFFLEQSRLIHVEEGQRNYHIFYQLVAGLDSLKKTELNLKEPEDYMMLTNGETLVTVGSSTYDDERDFADTCAALSTIGITADEQKSMVGILAGLLHLGNVTFQPFDRSSTSASTSTSTTSHKTENDINISKDKASTSPNVDVAVRPVFADLNVSLDFIAPLLGLAAKDLETNLTNRFSVSGRGSITIVPLTTRLATNSVHALIKYVYSVIFDFMVVKINLSHRIVEKSAKSSFVGILDIFGFEVIKTNSFEQLCINFANEMLQHQFNHEVFVLESERYESEGLNAASIEYQNNQPVIDLISSKKISGLFIILEEHCLMNRIPDNLALLNSFHKKHEKHQNYAKPRFNVPEFIINHTMSGDPVTYTIDNFIEKNTDFLSDELLRLIRNSTNPFFEAACASAEEAAVRAFILPSTSTMASKYTISSVFRSQLEDLVATLQKTTPHYIKCIKPNASKVPDIFDNQVVAEQLRYSGVLEVARIWRQGYPVRLPFAKFRKDFKMLSHIDKDKEVAIDDVAACEHIIANHLSGAQAVVGRTLIFLQDGVLEELGRCVRAFYFAAASRIQSKSKGKAEAKRFRETVSRITLVQMFCRKIIRIAQYRRARANIELVQRVVRGKAGRTKFGSFLRKIQLERLEQQSSVIIQKNYRASVARARFKVLKNGIHSIVLIQSVLRMRVPKEGYKFKLASSILLQNKMRRQQAKVELDARKLAQWRADVAYDLKKVEYIGAGLFQGLVRKHICMKRLEKSKCASVKVQGAVRVLIARKVLQFKREEMTKRRAAIKIQSEMRVFIAMKLLFFMKHEMMMTRASIKIQNATRMIIARRVLQSKREGMMRRRAAIKIQSVTRGFIGMKFLRFLRGELAKTLAAIKMQSIVRMMIACNFFHYKMEELIMDFASVEIQSFWRGFVGRRTFALLHASQLKVAIVFQSLVRARKQRTIFKAALRDVVQIRSAITIQSLTRSSIERDKLRSYRRAITSLQCSRRIKLSHVEARRLREVRDALRIVRLQALVRGMLEKETFENKKYSAIRLQARWRIVEAEAISCALRDLRDVKCATFLSAIVRRWIALQNFKGFRRAVIRVQSRQRARVGVKIFTELVFERDTLRSTRIQALMRARRQRVRFFYKRAAAIIIQRNIRMLKQYWVLKESLFAVTLFQSHYRKYHAIKSYQKDRVYLTTVQSILRRNNQERSFRKTLRLTRTIQKVVRQFFALLRMQENLMAAHKAAKAGKLESLVALLLSNEDLNLRGMRNKYDNGKSLLASATKSNDLGIVAMLCSDEQDVFRQDVNGDTPFHEAAKHLSFAVLKFFLDTSLNSVYEVAAEGKGTGTRITRQSWLIPGSPKSSNETAAKQRAEEKGEVVPSNNVPAHFAKYVMHPIIKEGFITKKKTNRVYERRWCVLRTDSLAYFKNQGDVAAKKEIQLKESIIKRSPTEKFTFEIHSPLLLDAKNMEGRMYFTCASEMEFQTWLTAFRDCDAQMTDVRDARSRSGPRSYLNMKKRQELTSKKNKHGETALHLVCRRSADQNDETSTTLAIEVALWLAENGCEIDSENADGNTSVHLAVIAGHMDLAAALVRKGGSMGMKNNSGHTPLDLLSKSCDIEKICMVGAIGVSEKKNLLLAPRKTSPHLSFLSMLFERLEIKGAADIVQPFISIFIYDSLGNEIEERQDIARCLFKKGNSIYFVSTYHMQTPLENLVSSENVDSSGCFIVIEIKDEYFVGNKVVQKPIVWSYVKLDDDFINTAQQVLKCHNGSHNGRKQDGSFDCEVFKSLYTTRDTAKMYCDTHLTRKEK